MAPRRPACRLGGHHRRQPDALGEAGRVAASAGVAPLGDLLRTADVVVAARVGHGGRCRGGATSVRGGRRGPPVRRAGGARRTPSPARGLAVGRGGWPAPDSSVPSSTRRRPSTRTPGRRSTTAPGQRRAAAMIEDGAPVVSVAVVTTVAGHPSTCHRLLGGLRRQVTTGRRHRGRRDALGPRRASAPCRRRHDASSGRAAATAALPLAAARNAARPRRRREHLVFLDVDCIRQPTSWPGTSPSSRPIRTRSPAVPCGTWSRLGCRPRRRRRAHAGAAARRSAARPTAVGAPARSRSPTITSCSGRSPSASAAHVGPARWVRHDYVGYGAEDTDFACGPQRRHPPGVVRWRHRLPPVAPADPARPGAPARDHRQRPPLPASLRALADGRLVDELNASAGSGSTRAATSCSRRPPSCPASPPTCCHGRGRPGRTRCRPPRRGRRRCRRRAGDLRRPQPGRRAARRSRPDVVHLHYTDQLFGATRPGPPPGRRSSRAPLRAPSW